MTERDLRSRTLADPIRVRAARDLRTELEDRSALAFVHCGSIRDPAVRYGLLAVGDGGSGDSGNATGTRPDNNAGADTTVAIAFDGERWFLETATRRERARGAIHPADAVATAISSAQETREQDERRGERERRDDRPRVLAPATIPHDAACYLDQAGFDLASSDVLSRLRTAKSADELAAIERAQAAASSGLERVRSMLAATSLLEGDDTEREATRVRSLEFEGDPLAPATIASAADAAVLEAGCRPVSTTVAGDDPMTADRPAVITTLVRTPSGYHGRLARTFVVDPEGGAERRAHVALTQAFRSVRTMAGADGHTISALESDLEAEIRAFGFGDADAVDVRVSAVGLEPRERPIGNGESVAVGTTICVDAVVGTDAGCVRLADVLVRTEDDAQWLSPASWSMRPSSE